MSNQIIVHKGRTCTLTIALGIDVSSDTITSEVRTQPDVSAPLLMTWDVDFESDGTDGELVLTVDNSVTAGISATSGYMDLKRVTGGEPVPVWDAPLEVIFQGSVTQ